MSYAHQHCPAKRRAAGQRSVQGSTARTRTTLSPYAVRSPKLRSSLLCALFITFHSRFRLSTRQPKSSSRRLGAVLYSFSRWIYSELLVRKLSITCKAFAWDLAGEESTSFPVSPWWSGATAEPRRNFKIGKCICALSTSRNRWLTMDWLDTTERDEILRQPFEVSREVPHQLTKRVKTLTDTSRDRALATQGQTLCAKPDSEECFFSSSSSVLDYEEMAAWSIHSM